MKIKTLNTEKALDKELTKYGKLVENSPDAIVVDWVPNLIDEVMASKKGTTVIVFDRYSLLTDKEIAALRRRFNVVLMEPYVISRPGFIFQPVFGFIPKEPNEMPLYEHKRDISLVTIGNIPSKMKSFERYVLNFSKMGDYPINVVDGGLVEDKIKELVQHNIEAVSSFMLKEAKSSVLLGSREDYKRGRLDLNVFAYLENGVVPLLPMEHRFYHCVFDNLVIKKLSDMEFIIKTLETTDFGNIFRVYENMRRYFPEMAIDHFAERISWILSK